MEAYIIGILILSIIVFLICGIRLKNQNKSLKDLKEKLEKEKK